VIHLIGTSRYAWIQVIRGGVNINGVELQVGDGAAVSKADFLKITAINSCVILLFDLK
jgi:redox-sensitive bicupin YhaK (pirin superfamily)